MANQHLVPNIAPAPQKALLCPSAQPDMEGARVLGVISGSAEQSQVAYLNSNVPVTAGLLAAAAPLKPTEVFRFAAHCEENKCRHFDGSHCQLATRIVQILPAVTDGLPPCLIRAECRWFQQEGKAACMRCPQVVTESYEPDEDFKRAALGQAIP
ncbi:MAG: nitrogen fixation protein [Acidobacteria bacterium]|nr:MAG: nitrogen fixation protein [Acidobacteriota bacterium]